MSKLIVGNWKMNLTAKQSQTLVKKLQERTSPKRGTEVVICPSLVNLFPVKEVMERGHLKLGAQNCHYLDEGAVTGEVSAAQLHGLVEYVIIGHSERRAQFGEDDKLVAQKLAAAIRNGLKPILCVGENLNERHHDLSTKVVVDQLTGDLSLLTADDLAHLTIAYEPVWAIGTGQSATPDQIEPMIHKIVTTVEDLYGEGHGGVPRVLYGAGVEPEFVGTILSIPDVSGLLVGGASLHYEKFGQIVETAQGRATEA